MVEKKEVKKPEKIEGKKAVKKDHWKILEYSKLTEKAISNVELQNKLVFIVRIDSTKDKIKKAVEQAFDVKVDKVNTVIDTKGQKKAFVKLKPDYSALDIATRLGMM